jgi:RNA ligase
MMGADGPFARGTTVKDGILKTIALLRSGELATRYHKLVSVQHHPDGSLAILNYTTTCQYARLWDEVTLACRGLIVDTRRWDVAAWPFAKFFNLGERPETGVEALPPGPFEVFEKLDGSLGIFYRTADGPALASRGSFTSDQALRGTHLLRQLSHLRDIPERLTLLFEIIYPENKSVIKYGFAGLVLLAAFDRVTGAELPWPEVAAWAARLGCRTPQVLPFGTLAEVIDSRTRLPADLEGYVLRFAGGLRVKLKGEAFLTLHKLVWGLSEKRVLEALTAGTYAELLQDLPEEFRAEIEVMAAKFREQAAAREVEVLHWFGLAPRGTDRKTFALWVQVHVPRLLWAPLFQLLDGITPNWYKLVEV